VTVYGGAASEEELEPPELDELELLDDALELLEDEPPPSPGRARFMEAAGYCAGKFRTN
jgi:hypothetical protein